MKLLIAIASLGLLASPMCLAAGKSCDELKTEIAAKIDGKGVKNYSLDIVDEDKAGDAKVVGQCEGGKKKIVYSKK